jgi:hypothetical protein
MAKITDVEFKGHAATVDAPDGWTLMQAAARSRPHRRLTGSSSLCPKRKGEP